MLPVLAGSTGLEPATPGSTVQCANQLRHNPVFQKVSVLYHILVSVRKGVFEKNLHDAYWGILSRSRTHARPCALEWWAILDSDQ